MRLGSDASTQQLYKNNERSHLWVGGGGRVASLQRLCDIIAEMIPTKETDSGKTSAICVGSLKGVGADGASQVCGRSWSSRVTASGPLLQTKVSSDTFPTDGSRKDPPHGPSSKISFPGGSCPLPSVGLAHAGETRV